MAFELEDIVTLNVRGKFFTTQMVTLTKEPTSVLGKIFTGKKKVYQDTKGRYKLDVDPVLFRHIMDYLRHGTLSKMECGLQRHRLLHQAKALDLSELVKFIEKALNDEPASQIHYITISYRGTFNFGRDRPADVKFRKITRILVAGKLSICRQVFGDQLNDTRNPDRDGCDGYSARLYLTHKCLKQAFDSLHQEGFRMVASSASETNGFCSNSLEMADEENRWQHYNEFVFCK